MVTTSSWMDLHGDFMNAVNQRSTRPTIMSSGLRGKIAFGGPVYKNDPFLLDLRCKGSDAYAKDESGDFIIVGVRPPNMKMLRFLLKRQLAKKYGQNRKIRVPPDGKRTCHWHASEARQPAQAEYGSERQDERVEVDRENDSRRIRLFPRLSNVRESRVSVADMRIKTLWTSDPTSSDPQNHTFLIRVAGAHFAISP